MTASGSLGGLPATGSLLQVDPAGAVQLGALKAAGNPLAHGSAQPVDPGHVAIRLVETRGGDSRRRRALAAGHGVRAAVGRSAGAAAGPPPPRPTLHGHQIGTALARLDLPRLLDAENTVLAPDAEIAQPLYARYWLHNRGPAPLGGLPAVAHLHPHQLTADRGLRGVAAPDRWPATAPMRR